MVTAASPLDANDTRHTILRIARELIQTRSYQGLSFQELADRVGIRKASLYHHFASKEALGVAVIARALEMFERWRAAQEGLPPQQQLLAYIAMFRDKVGAGERMCPGGAMSAGWDCLEPGLQETVKNMHQQQLWWLAKIAGQLPTVKSEAQAQAFAANINAVCQGGLLVSRVNGSVDHFDLATEPIVSQLRALG